MSKLKPISSRGKNRGEKQQFVVCREKSTTRQSAKITKIYNMYLNDNTYKNNKEPQKRFLKVSV